MQKSVDISAIFPGFAGGRERVAVFSPHDDDGLLGAGYALLAALGAGARVFVVIFCAGDCGYSDASLKQSIVSIREAESKAAYARLGIPEQNVTNLGLPDFSAYLYMANKLAGGGTGAFTSLVWLLREIGATRLIMPNHNREHADHEAASFAADYFAPQAGDAVVTDIGGNLSRVVSALQYSVWADFSPEDALEQGKLPLRANRAIAAPMEAERLVCEAISCFKSQGRIIEDLMEARIERRTGDKYIELYIERELRPKLNYGAYGEAMRHIDALP